MSLIIDISEKKNEIKRLLKFYIGSTWSRCGMKWTFEHDDEIDDLVECIDKVISMRLRETLRSNKKVREILNTQSKVQEYKSC